MAARTELLDRVARQVADLYPAMVATRRALHRTPEVGWLEYRTASRICAELAQLGIAVRTGRAVIADSERLGVPDEIALEAAYQKAVSAGAPLPWLEQMRGGYTGVLADIETGRPGPCIAFRFDLDALPIREAADAQHRPAAEGWASTSPGTMHACGHDGHMSIGLALARLAVGLAPELCGHIRLIFQPAEEGVRGAAAMNVACDGVDKLFSLHLGLGIPTGTIIGGATHFLATKEIHAHFTGRAAHAGVAPEDGRSALLAAAQATLAIHTLPQNARHLVRVNAGILRGGVATNIVPPEADLYYRVRSDDHDAIEELDARTRQAVRASAMTYGCEAEMSVTGQSNSEDSNAELAALVVELARDISGVTSAEQHHDFGGSEDATLLMSEIHRRGGQATYIMLGSDIKGGHHNDHFDFDERSLGIGAELLGRLMVYLLDASERNGSVN